MSNFNPLFCSAGDSQFLGRAVAGMTAPASDVETHMPASSEATPDRVSGHEPMPVTSPQQERDAVIELSSSESAPPEQVADSQPSAGQDVEPRKIEGRSPEDRPPKKGRVDEAGLSEVMPKIIPGPSDRLQEVSSFNIVELAFERLTLGICA